MVNLIRRMNCLKTTETSEIGASSSTASHSSGTTPTSARRSSTARHSRGTTHTSARRSSTGLHSSGTTPTSARRSSGHRSSGSTPTRAGASIPTRRATPPASPIAAFPSTPTRRSTPTAAEKGKAVMNSFLKKIKGPPSGSEQLALDAKAFNLDKGRRRFTVNAQAFTLKELVHATDYFNPSRLLGKGGFGPVYWGYLEEFQDAVAIKRLDVTGGQGVDQFVVEVKTLDVLDHPNLIKLIGYCAEKDMRLLVYELMPLRSLDRHLFDLDPTIQPLDWDTRMQIITDIASGLEYLHDRCNPAIIYRDLKTSNILLDHGYRVKLSDFGMAREGPTGDKTHVSTRVMGSRGYCAPEYRWTGRLTFKSDMYGFGVVILELITGRKAFDKERPHAEQFVIDWAGPLLNPDKCPELVDPLLKGRYSKSQLVRVVSIAASCIDHMALKRPAISDVVAEMDLLHKSKNDPATRRVKVGEASSSGVKVEEGPSSGVKVEEGPSSGVKVGETSSSGVKVEEGPSSGVKVGEASSRGVKVGERPISRVRGKSVG